MTRTAIRHTLSALAAIALASAFASSPASADERQNPDAGLSASLITLGHSCRLSTNDTMRNGEVEAVSAASWERPR